MTDQIFLKDYVISADVGAFQEERENTQDLAFHITVDLAPQKTATDEVDNILSYDVLLDAVHDTLANKRYNLLETMAENIADLVRINSIVEKVHVTIEKTSRIEGKLGVSITREGNISQETSSASASAILYKGEPLNIGSAQVVILEPSATKAINPAELRAYCLHEDARAWVLSQELNLPVVDTKVEAQSLISRGESFIRAFGKQPFDLLPQLDDFSPDGIINWHCDQLNLSIK